MSTKTPDLTITRDLAAPREKVFRAWVEPEELRRWWGPKGFTTPYAEFDPRPGGAVRVDMRGPDGVVFTSLGEVDEIEEPERLVVTTTGLGPDGEMFIKVRNAVTFAEHEGGTRLTMEATILELGPNGELAAAGMEQGWNETLDRLGAHVEAA
jgi:uncharacterized protein YndB with AHSA1/START domain